MTLYRCDTCEKNYKSYQSLWNHNKKFHKIDKTVRSLSPQNPQLLPQSPQLLPQNPQLLPQNPQLSNKTNTDTDNLIRCNYCKKKLSRIDNKTRHEKTCKKKLQSSIIDELEKENETNILKKEIVELKNQLQEVLQTLKIHPKTLKKINNNIQNNNTNNIQNNNINNIQNNNITIVKFGTEYLSELLTNNEMKYIISRIENSLRESIKQVHFNDNRPEYKNIYITNIHDSLAYVYNGKKFEAINKMSALSELMRNHIDNIDEYISNEDNELSEYKMKHINKLIERVNIELKSDTIKHFREVNRIKEFIYNNSNKKMLLIQNTK